MEGKAKKQVRVGCFSVTPTSPPLGDLAGFLGRPPDTFAWPLIMQKDLWRRLPRSMCEMEEWKLTLLLCVGPGLSPDPSRKLSQGRAWGGTAAGISPHRWEQPHGTGW